MKEIPILYSGPMIQAKIAGRKNQTRRIVKVQPSLKPKDHYEEEVKLWKSNGRELPKYFEYWWPSDAARFMIGIHEMPVDSPYGSKGDLLWARETWKAENMMSHGEYEAGLRFIADNKWVASDSPIVRKFWVKHGDKRNIPNIFLPKDAARIWDRVVSVRVERLQDISEEDAIAEGIQELLQSRAQRAENGRMFRDYSKKPEMFNDGVPAKKSYETLWTKINGQGSWESNPFVWRIETETLSTTGKPIIQ